MKIEIIRDQFKSNCTLGRLTVVDDAGNIQYSCYTLEDAARPIGVKIKGETCIPEGEYKVSLTDSQRFGKLMPLIYNQPDGSVKDAEGASWSGIRIHAGNTSEDTEGCILPGETRNSSSVGDSRKAFEKLLPFITKNPVQLVIENRPG